MMLQRQSDRARSALALACLATSCGEHPGRLEVITEWPHDPSAFTQGLVWHNGQLLESVGGYGSSEVRVVDPATGTVWKAAVLAENRFGEGLSIRKGRIYQLTFRSGIGYVFEAATLSIVDSFAISGEGWGLAIDGQGLLTISDGSDSLRFVSPETFKVVRTVKVAGPAGPVTRLNELEYYNGMLLANIAGSDSVALIDALSGRLAGAVDLSRLYPRERRAVGAGDMNGIAITDSGTVLVTGKRWPILFEIRRLPGMRG